MFSIETKRLQLRLFQPSDIPLYYTLVHSDPDVMRFITGTPLSAERSQAMLEKFMHHQAQYGFSVWAVTDKATSEVIGHGGLFTLPTQLDVEVDYGFARAHWGKGYATEAARAILRFGFEEAKLNQIYALSFPENIASQRVMQKLGMTYQGKRTQFYNLELETYTIAPGELDTTEMDYQIRR